MLYGAGGLEGRGRPSKGVPRTAARQGGAHLGSAFPEGAHPGTRKDALRRTAARRVGARPRSAVPGRGRELAQRRACDSAARREGAHLARPGGQRILARPVAYSVSEVHTDF